MRLLCHFEGGASDAAFRHPGPSLVQGDTVLPIFRGDEPEGKEKQVISSLVMQLKIFKTH